MSLLAVDRAIRARLRGEPVDSTGRSKNGTGVLIPVLKNESKTSSQGKNGNWSVEFTGMKRQVPIFRYKDDGEEWKNIRPCVVYRRIGFVRNDEQSPFRTGDEYGTAGENRTVVDRAGRTVATGKQYNTVIAKADSYNYQYQFDIWAESQTERDLILEALIKVFPAHGYLDYTQRDGSTLRVDMVQEDVSDVETPIGEEEDREAVHTVLTYRVEAFEDHTQEVTRIPAVTDATLETVDSTDSTETSISVRTSKLNNGSQ